MAKAAEALGHPADATRFTAVAAEIKNAFNSHFLNATGDAYSSGRQTTSILPLAFGMVPEANRKAVGERLVRTILTDHAGHLDTGIFGTRYLVDALASIGRIDVALTVLTRTTYPSFGFQISHGATTSWEQWTYAASMLTHDHAMFAGVNASLYTQLAGIRPAEPGYRKVLIAPQIPPGLDHVSATQQTVHGKVSSRWTRTNRSLTLSALIPPNATATIRVPLLGATKVTAPPGARLLGKDTEHFVYAVPSGSWTFRTH